MCYLSSDPSPVPSFPCGVSVLYAAPQDVPALTLRNKRIYLYIFIYNIILSSGPHGLQLPAFRIHVRPAAFRKISAASSASGSVRPVADPRAGPALRACPDEISSRQRAASFGLSVRDVFPLNL